MKKEEKNHNKKGIKKGINKNDINFYKFLLVLAVFFIIIFLVLVFIFYKPKKNDDSGLSSVGVMNPKNIGNYSYDPQKLADGKHNLFIDFNNPICSNSYSRNKVLNPKTPWCDTSVFYHDSNILNSGDIVFIRNGTDYNVLSFPVKFEDKIPINESQLQNDSNDTKDENFAIEQPNKSLDYTFYIFVGIALFLLVIIIIIVWFVIKHFKRMNEIDSLKRMN
jgi:hypothetical protein